MLSSLIQHLNHWVWSYPLLLLLVLVGLYFTVILRGLQFRYLGYALKLIFKRHPEQGKGEVSQFQALMTAMSATIGIGSITGVATALATGGLGALFWMWVVGFFGLATKYAEALLGIKYRSQDASGSMRGGPMYYLERGLGWKKWGVLFAIGTMVAALTTGNMVQSNSVADALVQYVSIDRFWIGFALCLFTGLVLIKGIKSIAWVTQVLVPLMALIYLMAAISVLVVHVEFIPQGLSLIFKEAFNPKALLGGSVGSSVLLAMRMGISRGIFSNEAGLGSSPIAAAAAKTDTPGRQAMISMSGAFIATFIVCTVTGLVIATSRISAHAMDTPEVYQGSAGVIHAFNQAIPHSGWCVSFALVMFGYTTILGWAYYGEKSFEYLFGSKYLWSYRLIYIVMANVGAVLSLDLIWGLSDLSNACMAVPNLIGLLGLRAIVKSESKHFTDLVEKESAIAAQAL